MGRVTTSDGVQLHAEAVGSGPPILFLHELAGDHRSWSLQVAGLSDEFRCITFAARGYPPSDVPLDSNAYSFRRGVEDAVDVMDAFGLARVHVVGLSMGGYCALHLGALHPDRVSSLLVASTGSGSDPNTRSTFLTDTRALAEAFMREGAQPVADRVATLENRIQLKRKRPDLWSEFVAQLGEHSTQGMALTINGVQLTRPSVYDITDELQQISAPTLVMNGDEDDACLDVGLLIKRTVRTAALMVIPNSGHLLNLEDPTGFNEVVRTFIRTVDRGLWPFANAPR